MKSNTILSFIQAEYNFLILGQESTPHGRQLRPVQCPRSRAWGMSATVVRVAGGLREELRHNKSCEGLDTLYIIGEELALVLSVTEFRKMFLNTSARLKGPA